MKARLKFKRNMIGGKRIGVGISDESYFEFAYPVNNGVIGNNRSSNSELSPCDHLIFSLLNKTWIRWYLDSKHKVS